MLLVGLGRFVQDLLLWATSEFDYVRLGDGFVQCSSIMPQKRNPVAFEHARAIGSKALGQAQAIVTSVHNTPFGDIVDTEDDLQPLVFSMFRDATRVVKLVAAAIRTAEFDREAAGTERRRRLDDADGARRHARARSRSAVQNRARDRLAPGGGAAPQPRAAAVGAAGGSDVRGPGHRRSPTRIAIWKQILSPRHFVNVRKTYGGTGPRRDQLAPPTPLPCI